MDDQVVLWVRRDADGVERRCEVALIGEDEFELRVWRGPDLIVNEDFPSEASMLERATALASEQGEAAR
jgi:hypothetical protein